MVSRVLALVAFLAAITLTCVTLGVLINLRAHVTPRNHTIVALLNNATCLAQLQLFADGTLGLVDACLADALGPVTTAGTFGPLATWARDARGRVLSATNWTLEAGPGITVTSTDTTLSVGVNSSDVALAGDVTGTLVNTMLPAVGTPGTYGPYAIVTTDTKGRVSAATNYSLVGSASVDVSTAGTTTTVSLASNITFSTPNLTCMAQAPITVAPSTSADFQVDCSIPDAGWTDVSVGPIAMTTGPSAPSFTAWRGTMRAYEFPGSGTQAHETWGSFHIPHTIKPGTGVYFHVHWLPNAAAPTGNVTWNFEYTYAGPGDTQTFPATATVSATAAQPAQYTHMSTEIATPVLTGQIEVDGVILLRVYRDPALASDTSTDSAFLLFIDAHIQTTKWSTKYRNKQTGSFYV